VEVKGIVSRNENPPQWHMFSQ